MNHLTSDEKKKIYEEEKTRLEAREKVKADKGQRDFFIGFIGLIIIVIIIWASGIFKTSKSENPELKKSIISAEDKIKYEEGFQKLKDSGILAKINIDLNEVYVFPSTWIQLNVDQKEIVGKALAFYFGYKKGTDLNWVDIYDFYSGKKVAKYSETWGFKAY